VGCGVGSPVHQTSTYNKRQSVIEHNNKNLLLMKIGVYKDETMKLMGHPELSEGYDWGSAWLYRTAMTSGVYGTSDSDFTPIVFDQDGKVIGWGRNFFTEHVKRYEINIKDK
jgi:outer membrane protein assembly factor BamE (lipoprotein component of BamABCDE complex)